VENVNSVPMSITAQTSDQLLKQGVISPADLAKVVPGFQYTQSLFGEPVFTLRGIGFYDLAVGARPAVTIYVDEVPLPFGVMTNFAGLDSERVEVLKGPQGTIFGENSTGGAINYIAAKPTKNPEAGFDISYGRFNDVEATGFVSGPITDQLEGRFSLRTSQSGDWQKSYTTADTLGAKNTAGARLLLDWKPADSLRFELSLTGWYDRSDIPAGQFVAFTPNEPIPLPGVSTYPVAPANDRAADWTPGDDHSHHAQFYQASLRTDYDLTSEITATSITSFMHWNDDYFVDADGETYNNATLNIDGQLDTAYQELRLAGKHDRLRWIAGSSFQYDRTREHDTQYNPYSTITHLFDPLNGGLPFISNPYFTDANYRTYAGFGNLDFVANDVITAHAGVRFTALNSGANGASFDSPNGGLQKGLLVIGNSLRAAIGLPPAPFVPNGPDTLNAEFAPAIAHNRLDQDNVSWRVGLDAKVAPTTLLYGNVSKGYKAGSFPAIEATFANQLKPVSQESVVAYEVGFKSTLFDRHLQFNGAIFYYDYKDKQFIGRINIPPLGAQPSLVNIPKSSVKGAEFQLTWRPIEELTATLGGTYLNSKVSSFENYDAFGNPINISGEAFPYTPTYQLVADAEYDHPLFGKYSGFVGISEHYQTSSFGGFGNDQILQIRSYGLLDLRAGVETTDGVWRVMAYGRNVTDTYYWNNVQKVLDTTARFAGMPATYGVTVSYRYK
jgi:iron complex outermembrane receptor protein